MSYPERRGRGGSIIWSLIVFIIIVVALFAVCDAMDESDDTSDLGWVPLTELAGGRDDECRNQCGNEHPDCYKAEAQCSDDDFSPSFDKSPVEDSFNVKVCVTPGSCTGEEEEA